MSADKYAVEFSENAYIISRNIAIITAVKLSAPKNVCKTDNRLLVFLKKYITAKSVVTAISTEAP